MILIYFIQAELRLGCFQLLCTLMKFTFIRKYMISHWQNVEKQCNDFIFDDFISLRYHSKGM